jgi:hypothetical protein
VARRFGIAGLGDGRELEVNAVVEKQGEAAAARVFNRDRASGQQARFHQ